MAIHNREQLKAVLLKLGRLTDECSELKSLLDTKRKEIDTLTSSEVIDDYIYLLNSIQDSLSELEWDVNIVKQYLIERRVNLNLKN